MALTTPVPVTYLRTSQVAALMHVSPTFPERLFAKIDAGGDCWEWTGATSKGYGVIGCGRRGGGNMQAHRAVWLLLVGVIAEGLTLDHLCRNRACCNPDHLQPVTVAENLRRGYGQSVRNVARQTCNHGHPWTPDNIVRNGKYRRCRTCVAITNARRAAA